MHLFSSSRGHSFVSTWQRIYLLKFLETSGQKKNMITLASAFYTDFMYDWVLSL